MNVPIIKLEVEGMKHTIHVALTQHAALMDTCVQAAVEEYCTPENINAVVRNTAIAALDAAVKEEVRSFFQHSRHGRLAVREAVVKYLDETDSWRQQL